MASEVHVDHILQTGILSNDTDLAREINRITGGDFNSNAAYNLQLVWSHTENTAASTPPGTLYHGPGNERADHQIRMLDTIFSSNVSDAEKLAQFQGLLSFYKSASNPNSSDTNGLVAWINGADPGRSSSSLSLSEEYNSITLNDIMNTDAYRDGASGSARNGSYGDPNADRTIFNPVSVPYSDDPVFPASEYRQHVGYEPLPDGSYNLSGTTILAAPTALLLVSTAADAADAHGSAALDLGSLALVSYGLYQDGILDDFSIGAAVDLVQNSNISELVGNSLDNLKRDVAIDAALTVAASALGVGLFWNGLQIVQSASGFDAALSYAAERAPDGHVIRIMDNLVDGAKTLFSGGGSVEAYRIADLIEQTDPELAVAVAQELIGTLSSLPTTNGMGLGLNNLDVNDLAGIVASIENTNEIFFDGATSLEDKVKYALGQSFLEEGNHAAFARLFPDSCFGPTVSIDMWPLESALRPGPDGTFDQAEVCAKIWKKPIELIEIGDIVVSFDANDNLVPGSVTRTFQNSVRIMLDFHGTQVTPGHVYYRPDSKRSHKFETLIDVLRDDGVIKHQDGRLIRAATNVLVDSPRDNFVQAVTRTKNADGSIIEIESGRIRLGTRFLVGSGENRKSYAVADLIEAAGGVVGEDELIRIGDGPGMAFHWEFGETLPKPEDFVLACSGVTLEEIYKAAEWEGQKPHLPAPSIADDHSPPPDNVMQTKSSKHLN